MGKALSQQQRILGLAVAVSRLRNGAPIGRTPKPHPDWRIPVVTGVWADLTVALVAHVLGGVGLRAKNRGRNVMLETTQVALNARSSAGRAVSSLLDRGLLACRPYMPFDNKDHGYSLTEAGLAMGLPHELTIPDLDRRLWLLQDDRKDDRSDWCLKDVLPSPADVLDRLGGHE